ncbi:hypothetical protein Anapl_02387 [Anas platyrhynchos]|uniref:Uncharacterized protein n=1 Tax=Anas platyrhynchos TaxID=8839 RepID=R0JYK3_ANAPL|nr:hypothetical protein Anapl_02387 [Anas platyrhynchos]
MGTGSSRPNSYQSGCSLEELRRLSEMTQSPLHPKGNQPSLEACAVELSPLGHHFCCQRSANGSPAAPGNAIPKQAAICLPSRGAFLDARAAKSWIPHCHSQLKCWLKAAGSFLRPYAGNLIQSSFWLRSAVNKSTLKVKKSRAQCGKGRTPSIGLSGCATWRCPKGPPEPRADLWGAPPWDPVVLLWILHEDQAVRQLPQRVQGDDGGGQHCQQPCWVSSAGEQLDEGPDGARAWPRGSFWMCGPCRTGGQEQLPPAAHRHGADAKKLHFAVLPCSLQYFSIAYPKLKATSVHSDFLASGSLMACVDSGVTGMEPAAADNILSPEGGHKQPYCRACCSPWLGMQLHALQGWGCGIQAGTLNAALLLAWCISAIIRVAEKQELHVTNSAVSVWVIPHVVETAMVQRAQAEREVFWASRQHCFATGTPDSQGIWPERADTDHRTPSGCSARYLASLTPCSQEHQALGAPRGAGGSWSRAGLHQLRLRLNHRYSTE